MSEGRRTRTRPTVKEAAICGARMHGGLVCKSFPGEGTDHFGIGRCSRHGGNRRKGINEAIIAMHENSIAYREPTMGVAIPLEPADALAQCIAIAAGEVAYLTMKVQEVDAEDVLARPQEDRVEDFSGDSGWVKRARTKKAKELNVWIRERQRAVDRLARLSKMAIDCGVAERQIALAEQQAEAFALAIQTLMGKLNLTNKQQALMAEALPAILYSLETPGQAIPGTEVDRR